jgi:hypothetical protein
MLEFKEFKIRFVIDNFGGKRSSYIILMRDVKDMAMCKAGLEM